MYWKIKYQTSMVINNIVDTTIDIMHEHVD
jgi:hypothetical protein